MRRYQLFIDGEFVEHSGGETLPVINPATEEVIAEVPTATPVDVDTAVLAADAAQPAWAKRPAIQRAGFLRELAKRIRPEQDRLARTVSEEQGKPLPQAQAEVASAADYLDYHAEFARRLEGEILESDRPNEAIFLFKQPLGVAAGILPWNSPFFMIVRKLAPALITGNTIVIKPSSETPVSAYEFAGLVASSTLPKGVVNVVSGGGGTVGTALAGHPKVGIVSFTGSVEGGQAVMRAAAAQVTKVSLELGGKAPVIVMPDADLDLAVRCTRDARIRNAGQVCTCPDRVYVHEAVAETFVSKITAAMARTTYGDPLGEPRVEMGPLVSRQQRDHVEAAVQRAVQEGATLMLGGRRPDRKVGYYFPPTVLTECDHKRAIMQEEIFGPVLPIATFRDLDEAIALANDCEYGLASSIYTRDLDVAMRACRELRFGETYINREHREAKQGFHAGCRKSGIGGADGKHGVEEYLQTHVVYLQYDQGKNGPGRN
jgi:lactaldehyde dehydrogenase/glycolaldehyde dehydrogenase